MVSVKSMEHSIQGDDPARMKEITVALLQDLLERVQQGRIVPTRVSIQQEPQTFPWQVETGGERESIIKIYIK
jgi:hypothetical protein